MSFKTKGMLGSPYPLELVPCPAYHNALGMGRLEPRSNHDINYLVCINIYVLKRAINTPMNSPDR